MTDRRRPNQRKPVIDKIQERQKEAESARALGEV
jgi:hypothetical protein